MKKITKDVDNILSLKEKEKICKELGVEHSLESFKSYYTTYTPVKSKELALDQQISISIAENEKHYIGQELREIKSIGPAISLSAFVRNRTVGDIDIQAWNERALAGLKTLSSKEYDEKELGKEKLRYVRLIEKTDDSENELMFYYETRLKEVENKLKDIERTKPKRTLRINARVTFTEANVIRWRASRLSLTVADYMRFLLFNYLPFSEADRYLTIDQRKRFYISVIDIARNGWGEAPKVTECPHCARHQKDIRILKEQIERYKLLLKKG